MKHSLFYFVGLLILLFLPFLAYAQGQKIYLDKFERDDFSTTAKDNPKYDGSGNLYSIIKVRTNNGTAVSREFKFSFGNMASSDAGQHEDEVWLYVQKNARKISISRTGFVPLKDIDLGMTVEAGKTYILTLSYVEPQDIVKKQWLAFSITPTDVNAVIKVKRDDARDYDVWGQALNGQDARNLECGRYQYQIVAENYDISEGVVTLNSPDATHTEKVDLRPNFGFLQINDVHGIAGAQIFIDNKFIGTIPYKSDVKWASGEYSLSITNGELYKTYNGKFTINKGETTVLEPRLESNAAETHLRVDADAQIFLDRRLLGTREWRGPLKAGRYEVECRMEKHKSTFKTITVIADNAQDILLESPKPITGALAITSTPLNAEIRIDGQVVGTTPMTVRELLIGQHTVELSLKNHKSEQREFEIIEGKTYELSIPLSDMANMTINTQPTGASLYLNGVSKGITPYSEVLPSGDYDVKLVHKKYVVYDEKVHFDSSNPNLTLTMQRQYMLPTCFYIQPTFQVGTFNSFGGSIGAYISNFNIEASFLSGMTKESLYWNYVGDSTTKEPVEESFSANRVDARIGYGFVFGTHFRVTPQVGVGITMLTGDRDSSGNAISGNIGARLEYALASFIGISVTPEYGMAFKKSNVFSTVSDASSTVNNWGGSANLKLGVYLFF